MRNFWPSLFIFLLALLCLLGLFNPAAIDATLLFLGLWFTLLLYVLLVAVAGALLAAAYLIHARIQNQRNRPVDGAYPLQRFRVRGGKTVVVNPTHMVGAAAVIDRRTGDYAEIEHPAGWGTMADIRHAIERSNTVRAMFPGDQARMNPNGAMSTMPRMPSMKQLEARAPAMPRSIPGELRERVIGEAALPPPAVKPLALSDAIQRSTADRWIIGQNPQSATLAAFHPQQSIHAGVIGATGTGKTACLGFLMAAHAIRHGYHTVILDPKGGADWRPWLHVAEWHEADRTTFGDQVRAVEAEHDRRALLVRRAGVSDAMSLHPAPRPLLVVIEEYGDLIAQLRRVKRSDAEAVDEMLDRLLRLARMTDIHLLFLDQYPEHWSNQVMAGTKAKIVFQLGPNQGTKVEEYMANRLPDRGRFLLRRKEYDAWHVAPALGALLGGLPARRAESVIDSTCVLVGDGEGVGAGEQPANHIDEPPPPKWDDVTAAFFQQRPELLTGEARGISDLARIMADADAAGKPHTAYKSIAHSYFHNFRQSVRLANGAALGVDITQGNAGARQA